MDRGALSDERVIDATRKFVCIRLATYEDKMEAKFLKEIYQSRSGELENTVFAILSPDGKEKLSRTHRSADHVFGGALNMANELNQIAERYGATAGESFDNRALPFAKTVDVGLNIGSADQLPVVLMYYENDEQQDQLISVLRNVAWQQHTIGQFVFVKTNKQKDVKPITGMKKSPGIYLVEPGRFGLSGKALHQLGADAHPDQLQQAMVKVIRSMPREHKDHNSHVREGISLGIEWESEIPETDPQAVRARKRARGNE